MKQSDIFPIVVDIDYELQELSINEFNELFSERQQEYFSGSIVVDVTSHLSHEAKQKIQERSAVHPKPWRFQWALVHRSAIVGWTYAYQSDHETLYMCNTAIDPEHRGKGLYARVLNQVITLATNEGFQLITSKHHASNSAVIVSKLKAGFMITGMTLDEKYGLMVLLTYYTDPVRRQLAVRRIGQTG